ncbi:hypothetical protein [Streptomyces sp. NBC_00620]|uniref:hypothetical protein n=1 Tax=Streptomyces sp. NBC_00620 TaxID=2903666 RepID=UPI002252EFDD|nr:hypothetical protein [Streptomyces sp. NBC_00620]MCX4974458.1 hypothetical protein [Streptomyces sp. NBC_00620]
MHEHEQPVDDEQLMAVLLGRPSPQDPGTAADRHAAAERDMAAVQGQLRRIGDGLARAAATAPVAPPEPRAPVRRSRRTRKVVLALAASVAVALVGTAAAYLVAHNGTVDGGADEARLTAEGSIACSTAVAEGTVARVDALGGDERFRVVLDVDRYYKPESGKPQLSFTTEGAETKTYYRIGVRMLVVVSGIAAEGLETFREGDPALPDGGPDAPSGPVRDALEWGRQWVGKALPGARGVDCPLE